MTELSHSDLGLSVHTFKNVSELFHVKTSHGELNIKQRYLANLVITNALETKSLHGPLKSICFTSNCLKSMDPFVLRYSFPFSLIKG